MGICGSKAKKNNKDKLESSALIEQKLKKVKKIEENDVKLLLLGPGNSGKSTILKQMKLINGGGFTKTELENFKKVIYTNLIQGMKELLYGLDVVEWNLEKESNDELADYIESLNDRVEEGQIPTEKTFQALKSLSKDSAIQKVQFHSGSKFFLNDSCK
jgi:guanine nucleotide-binding protein G(i) subunit alpha